MLPIGCGGGLAARSCIPPLASAAQLSVEEAESFDDPQQSVGPTFYVSSSKGDDRAEGKTPGTAWRTIGKVSSSRLLPGTRILFRRGDVWREQLTIPASGANGLPIVFGAYPNQSRDADRPVIAGSDAVTDWRPFAEGLYRARLDAAPANVYVDDRPVPLTRCEGVQEARSTENSWYYNAPEKFLYVQLAKRESPADHTIEAAVRDYDVYASGKSYITIDNLELKHAKLSAILAENDGSDFWTVSNCTIRNATEAAVHARPVDRDNAPMLRGWRVEGNKIGRIDGGSGLDYDRAGILLRHVKDAVVKDNTVATVNKMGITFRDYFKAGGSEGGLVTGNRLTDNQGNISIWMTQNAVVTGNVIYKSKGYGIGIGVRSHNALITYNSINNLRQSDDGNLYNGIDVNADSQRGRIFHNTIVNVRGFNLTLEQSDAPSNGWVIKNNIFDARLAPFDRHSNIAVDPLVVTYTFASNVYVPSRKLPNIVNHFHREDMTLPQWIAATGDKNSIVADPLFVNGEANDLRLAAGSPARGKAEPLAGINEGRALDIGAF